MTIPVLIEPIANDGFRATGGPPFAVTAQGTTREEALARLREAIDQRMVEGSVLVPLEIDTTEENPWNAVVGMLRDDPLFDEWQEAIAENRRGVDEDADDDAAELMGQQLAEHIASVGLASSRPRLRAADAGKLAGVHGPRSSISSRRSSVASSESADRGVDAGSSRTRRRRISSSSLM